jgi:predicted nucleic acid-binding Zn ribbon protein
VNRRQAASRSAAKQRTGNQAVTQGTTRGPQQIGIAITELMARRGYGQVEWREQASQAWKVAVGEHLASKCCVGQIRRGVVEVTVASSSVLQELAFRKQELLGKIQHSLPTAKIRNLRFRVGEVDNH